MSLRKSIIVYGLAMAALIGLLKFFEYRYFVRDLSLELYLGLIAAVFVALGSWIGWRLTRRAPVELEVLPVAASAPDAEKLKALGITKREFEVLELIAHGLSNQEIAERLFVSMSTVKSHSSNLFGKLDAKRRTQAIQNAKNLNILP
jgi:NarL family two-component system response regulator LiaR